MTVRRVAYVVNTFPKISETFIANELAELRRRDIDVLILALHEPAESLAHEFVGDAGLPDRTIYERSEFDAALRAFKPDVIHAHFATDPTTVARNLAAALDVPFTFTAHGHDIHRRPPPDFWLRATAAAAVVTVSRANAHSISERFFVPSAHVRVIPCGVDTARFHPNGARTSPPLIVCVARLVPVKNLGLLLEACAVLRARGVQFRAVVVGEGRSRAELEATLARLELENTVELAGAATQDRVVRYWQQATVATLTSANEGMPVSLMEAGACGVPSVATSVGGVPELVTSGVNGLLVRHACEAELADAIAALARSPALRARLGAEGRATVEHAYSESAYLESLSSLYVEVLQRRSEMTAGRHAGSNR
jgi:glycosyltransferase involved in cell wall biosynthesis